MEFDLEEITFALANALDLVGNDHHHGKRVAYIASEIGRHIGWQDKTLHDLVIASVLHDFGLSSTREFKQVANHFSPEGWNRHSERGWLLLSSFYPFAHLAPLVLHHHTPWPELQESQLADTISAAMANCIFLADRVEILISQEPELSMLAAVEKVCQVIEKHEGSLFSPLLVRTFLDISRNDAFWLYLDPKYLEQRVRRWFQNKQAVLDLPQVRQLSKLFADVVDSKSRFTAIHSRGVGQLAKWIGQRMGLPERQSELLEVAGFMHDIGKLRLPDEILEKPSSLTDGERAIVRRHTFDTFQILNSVRGLWGISEWAAFHHETPSGRGYPFGISDPLLCIEAKIIAAADVFQALAQERPYRPAMHPDEIMNILRKLGRENTLSQAVIEQIGQELDAAFLVATKGKILGA